MSWQQRIEQALEERRGAAAYRQRQVNQGGNGRYLQLDGQRYVNFSGNDYLGLSQHPEVIAAWQQGHSATVVVAVPVTSPVLPCSS